MTKPIAEPFADAKWDEVDLRGLSYVNGTAAGSYGEYTNSDYIMHTEAAYTRLDNLAENKTFNAETSKAERICVIENGKTNGAAGEAGAGKVTITCAAWFEGTDPNVVSSAKMECLKASMTFYARTVNNI